MSKTKSKSKHYHSRDTTEYDIEVADDKICSKYDAEKYKLFNLPNDLFVFTVYGYLSCRYCHEAIELLQKTSDTKTGLPVLYIFRDIEVLSIDIELHDQVMELANNQKTVPIIFNYTDFIGGLSELRSWLEMNEVAYPIVKQSL